MIIYPTYDAFATWLVGVLTPQEKEHLRKEAETFLGGILAYMERSGSVLDATPTEAAVERFLEAISE